jgi:hypothetical protein
MKIGLAHKRLELRAAPNEYFTGLRLACATAATMFIYSV